VRDRARRLGEEVADYQNAIRELTEQIAKDKTHRNELLSLGTRFRRTHSARAVLRGVSFSDFRGAINHCHLGKRTYAQFAAYQSQPRK